MYELISIIVPVYRVGKYLIRCVESIIAQTYPFLEIILVDDGSNDDSAWICDELVNKYNHVENRNIKVIHKSNGGVTSARLSGLSLAVGEWIAFVDADDEIDLMMYQKLYDNAMVYNAQISHCGYRVTKIEGNIHYLYNTGHIVKQDKTKGLVDLIEGSMIEPSLSTKLFQKSLFRAIIYDGVLNLSIKINEDFLMNYYLFKEADNSIYEDVCLYNYIERVGSAVTTWNENHIWDPIEVRKIILNDVCNSYKNNIQRVRTTAQVELLNGCKNSYNGLLRDRGRKDKNAIKAIEKVIKENKRAIRYCSKKSQVLIWIILYFPRFYYALRKGYTWLKMKKLA